MFLPSSLGNVYGRQEMFCENMFPDFNGPSCLFHANIHVTADIFKLSNTFNPIQNGGGGAGEGWGAPNIIFLLNPKKVKGKVINFFAFKLTTPIFRHILISYFKSNRLRYSHLKTTPKLCATCQKWHLFWLPIFLISSVGQNSIL